MYFSSTTMDNPDSQLFTILPSTLGSSHEALSINERISHSCLFLYLHIGHFTISQDNALAHMQMDLIMLAHNNINLTIVSPSHGTLAIVSCQACITLVITLMLFSQTNSPSHSCFMKSYLLQSYKPYAFPNAGNCIRLISAALFKGLNLPYLLVRFTGRLYIPGLLIKMNPLLFSGNNNVHYLLCLTCSPSYAPNTRLHYSLIHVVGRFGSIGI